MQRMRGRSIICVIPNLPHFAPVQFDKIRSDICSLNEQLAGPGPIPSDFLVSQPDQTAALRKWEELGELRESSVYHILL